MLIYYFVLCLFRLPAGHGFLHMFLHEEEKRDVFQAPYDIHSMDDGDDMFLHDDEEEKRDVFQAPYDVHSTDDGDDIIIHNEQTDEDGSGTYDVYSMDSANVQYMNITFGHGESPVWDSDTQTLYWVDVLSQDVHSLHYITLKHKVKHLDCGEVNLVIPVASSDNLLIGCRSKVFVMNWNRGIIKEIAQLDAGLNSNILNEGKCDAYGRLWAGTKGPQAGDSVSVDFGTFYKLERPCYRPLAQIRPVTISNGLVWALNNSLLYYIDSATNQVDAFQYDLDRGIIGERRKILNTSEWGYHEAVPDGMTIDREGFLWIALYFYGQVIRVDPDAGKIVTVYDLPVPRVTSMTWVGRKLEDLVITTSQRNLQQSLISANPLAGTIFMLNDLGTGGVPDYKFVYDSSDICEEDASYPQSIDFTPDQVLSKF